MVGQGGCRGECEGQTSIEQGRGGQEVVERGGDAGLRVGGAGWVQGAVNMNTILLPVWEALFLGHCASWTCRQARLRGAAACSSRDGSAGAHVRAKRRLTNSGKQKTGVEAVTRCPTRSARNGRGRCGRSGGREKARAKRGPQAQQALHAAPAPAQPARPPSSAPTHLQQALRHGVAPRRARGQQLEQAVEGGHLQSLIILFFSGFRGSFRGFGPCLGIFLGSGLRFFKGIRFSTAAVCPLRRLPCCPAHSQSNTGAAAAPARQPHCSAQATSPAASNRHQQ